MKDFYGIVRDKERYGELGNIFPERFVVYCTKEAALALAGLLTENYPGCDGLFRVEE